MGARRMFRPTVVRDFGVLSVWQVGPFPVKVRLSLCFDESDGVHYLRLANTGAVGYQLHFVEQSGFESLRRAVADAMTYLASPNFWGTVGSNVVRNYGRLSKNRMGGATFEVSLGLREKAGRHYLRFRSSARRKFPPAFKITWCEIDEEALPLLKRALEEIKQQRPELFVAPA